MKDAEGFRPLTIQAPGKQAKRLRIALIDPLFYTLAYDAKLARALGELGHHVTMYGEACGLGEECAEVAHSPPFFFTELVRFGIRSWSRPALRLVGALQWLGMQLPKGASQWRAMQLANGALHWHAMQRLVAELRVVAPDIIHFQWTPLPVIDRLFMRALRRVAPLVLTAHDSCPFNGDIAPRPQRWAIVSILREFDGIVVHTEGARERLAAYGVPPKRLVRIPHGLLSAGGLMTAHKAKPPPLGDRVRFLLFGKLKPYKGADLLLEAVRRLPADIQKRVEVLIVGKPYMDMAPLFDASRGLEACIRFDLRFVPDDEMSDLLAQTDVIVFPYREIDVSGVLMAALPHGRPIIASRVGGFAELLVDGRHGFLVPPGDIEALAAAMARLCVKANTRATMGAAVAELGVAVPSWDKIARQTIDFYYLLLREPKN